MFTPPFDRLRPRRRSNHLPALALATLALWTSLLSHRALAQTAVPLPLAAPTAPAPASAKPALPGPSARAPWIGVHRLNADVVQI